MTPPLCRGSWKPSTAACLSPAPSTRARRPSLKAASARTCQEPCRPSALPTAAPAARPAWPGEPRGCWPRPGRAASVPRGCRATWPGTRPGCWP
ncbi:hypothetical protein EK904_012423 [Melospiza melodia maxima]|nr:hypothetical protein EK904_012423 [Melospiza melodia maxima]